ncbi:MAG: hypothetical protein H0Z29_05770 [Candidatus Marinimicrobia bacterium]|nr:hypothetical protein [Candidatus Neomarinimicrobiota bacterium]
MDKKYSLRIRDICTISGSEISEVYEKNRMTVHFQGMSKTLLFPQTIALQGIPTLSIGISPDGLYNRLNNAGRLILLNQNAIQFGSAPFIRVDEKTTMLTRRNPALVETPDDVPALKNYYHPPLDERYISISMATPLAEVVYNTDSITVSRKFISPFLYDREQALMPIGVEEFEIKNNDDRLHEITLVLPRPSLVNLQEKELKPLDQDTVYICSTPIKGHVHTVFEKDGIKGIVMASKECEDRMVIACPETDRVKIDLQPYFCLNRLKQDLLLNDDGTFYEKRPPKLNQDYGSAISLTFSLGPKESIKIPLGIALDFPIQRYIDGAKFERRYVKSFKNKKTRATDLVKVALKNYQAWFDRTLTIQQRIYDLIRNSPSYKDDEEGALRLARLIFNEFSCPISNAAIWIKDKKGRDVARFLECFDYAYLDPSDVEWYSMILLVLFPDIEQELCQQFINSILDEDNNLRFYHYHASFVEARKHFEEHPEEYESISLTQIRDKVKIKGSVYHDLGAMPKGHPLRNVSEYAWYNNNYWVDLFPKLATRVLRNVKFLGDLDFLRKNWSTLKLGFEYLRSLDHDGDGIPEGNPGEVKNTFDNLPLFGVDAYDATIFMAGCRAMSIMADMMNDLEAKKEYEESFKKASEQFEKLWREKKNKNGIDLQYYVTCYDTKTGEMNTDVWLNQLDAVWFLISIGEESFIPEDRIKKILKTIFENNETLMGWAMCRTEDGSQVESEQGQDVYTTSNYVFAELLDYYGMAEESKAVYKKMDKLIFGYGNSLISPDNVRAELELEEGESEPRPHYIVAAYPRPGAVFTHIILQHIKDIQKNKGVTKISSDDLRNFIKNLMK